DQTGTYTLSLHDALPISCWRRKPGSSWPFSTKAQPESRRHPPRWIRPQGQGKLEAASQGLSVAAASKAPAAAHDPRGEPAGGGHVPAEGPARAPVRRAAEQERIRNGVADSAGVLRHRRGVHGCAAEPVPPAPPLAPADV